jgi:hypothetical protein
MTDGDDADRLARQAAIGAELRRVFDAVSDEPLPDSFTFLVRRLEQLLAEAEKAPVAAPRSLDRSDDTQKD